MSILRVTLALGAVLFACSSPVFAQGLTVFSSAGYDQALAAVDQATHREEVEKPPVGSAPQELLAPILHCQVRDPAGHLVTADNTPLSAALKAASGAAPGGARRAACQAALAQIALLRQGIAGASSAQNASAPASVRPVLLRNEFSSQPLPPPSTLDREMDAFGRWLGRLLDRLHGSPGPTGSIDPRVLLYILLGVAVLAVGLLIAYLIFAISQRLARRAPPAVPESGLALTAQEASLVATRDFDRLLDMAHQHAQNGDFRSGLRLAYLATLVFLDSEGLVRLKRSRTNWEYLRSIKAGGEPALYEALLPATVAFDRIWYGVRPAALSEFDEALSAHAQVRSLFTARPSKPPLRILGEHPEGTGVRS